jgi:hypothetical protein
MDKTAAEESANNAATTQERADETLAFAQNLGLSPEISALLLPPPEAAAAGKGKGKTAGEENADDNEGAGDDDGEENADGEEGAGDDDGEENADGNKGAGDDDGEENADGEEGAEGDEGEEDGEGDEEEEEAPAGSEAVQKRINKLTKARREAEEGREALRIENESLKAQIGSDGRPVATPNDPLADVTDNATLNARVQQSLAVKDWAKDHLDGGTMPDGKGGEVEFTAEQVRQMLANADAVLMVHVPKRANYLKTAGAFEEQALVRYPEFKKPDSIESKLADAIYREMPELKRFPNHKMVVGHIVAGLKAERAAADAEAKAKGKGKEGKGTKPAPKTVTSAFKPKTDEPIAPGAPIRSAAAPRKTTDNTQRAKEAKLKHVVEANGSVDALAAAFM